MDARQTPAQRNRLKVARSRQMRNQAAAVLRISRSQFEREYGTGTVKAMEILVAHGQSLPDPIPPQSPRPKGQCVIAGCDRDRASLGLCKRHYYAQRTHGDPSVNLRPEVGMDQVERILRAADVATGGCWLWTRHLGAGGYGRVWDPRRGFARVAHRVLWELLRGDLPEEMELDHTCNERSCINPDHLEPVTHAENMRRAAARRQATAA